MKRFIALALCILTIFSCLMVTASAAPASPDKRGIYLYQSNGSIKYSKTMSDADDDTNIEGYEIASWTPVGKLENGTQVYATQYTRTTNNLIVDLISTIVINIVMQIRANFYIQSHGAELIKVTA